MSFLFIHVILTTSAHNFVLAFRHCFHSIWSRVFRTRRGFTSDVSTTASSIFAVVISSDNAFLSSRAYRPDIFNLYYALSILSPYIYPPIALFIFPPSNPWTSISLAVMPASYCSGCPAVAVQQILIEAWGFRQGNKQKKITKLFNPVQGKQNNFVYPFR